MSTLQSLLEHEARLRHGAFGCIHKQQNAIHHIHDTLDLSSEIGVTGRIHDIDLDHLACFGIRHRNGCILCKDGDAALTLKIIGVHDALFQVLVFTEGMRLAQQKVHEGGFAVVHVGDDGDVAEVSSFN